MEWIEGLDLKNLIQGMRKMKQRIPLKVTLSLIADVAESLDVIYNQAPAAGRAPLRILHGNLKPSNIMVTPQGKVSLLDFGMTASNIGGRESETREMQYDAVEYVAPERLFFEPQGPASDIYSLAVTLFEMLAGKPLGKALPSAEQHQLRVEKYCQHLLRPMPLGLEVKDELADLLISGMAYESERRPMAYEFANRARRMADAIPGVTSVQWSQKAIPYFQQRLNRGTVDGTLQGSLLSEDTEVFERPKPVEDVDVDTSIMRRGAVADFVEASLDLNPQAVVEMTEQEDYSFESTAISEPELTKGASVVPLPPVVEPPPMPAVPKTQNMQNMSPTAHTVTVPKGPSESMEILDSDGPTQTMTSVDVRPQAMAPIIEEESGMSTKTLVGLFLGGAVLLLTGVLSVVWLFGSEESGAPIPTTVETMEEPDVAPSDSWEGTRFQSAIESKRIKVKCGLLKERGSEIVTLENIAGRECFVEVRTPDRQVFRTTVSDVQDGLYKCFENHSDSCVFSGVSE
jgi:serine/threonine protein kinase